MTSPQNKQQVHGKMVSCPICAKSVPLNDINDHLDACEAPRPVKRPVEVVDLEDEDDNEARASSDATEPVAKQEITPIKTQTPTPVKQTIQLKSKVQEVKELQLQLHKPLSERLRPSTLDEYIGQDHLLGPQGILRGFIENDMVPSMILWGPPGVGKTTIARIIAKSTRHKFIELNATNSSVSDLKKIFEVSSKELFLTKRRTILFCDEIHRYNKAQQDHFLPSVERGDVVLIGATTENPSFRLNNALLSRCKVFTLEPLTVANLYTIIHKGLLHINKMRKLVHGKPLMVISKDGIDYVAKLAAGDSRVAITCLELLDAHFQSTGASALDSSDIKPILARTHSMYDRMGDNHYDTISAFHKSVRGSDANAAMWYLGVMLQGGEDPLYIARRMIRIASEDVGILDDSCLPFAVATYEAVMKVGLPEADLALVHCAVKLCKAPKSILIYRGWGQVKALVKEQGHLPIPVHLRNAPTNLMKELHYGEEYKYPPNFKDGKVAQEYLPEEVRGTDFLKGGHLGEMID